MAVTVFKVHNSECDLHQDIMLFDVSWLMCVRFLVQTQKEESKVTARKTVFFSRHPEKMVFPKKSCWNMIFFVLSGKMIFVFHEYLILPPRRKMKDDLSQKTTGKYDIFFKCSEKMIFSKRWYRNMIFLVLSGRMVFFSPEHEIFSLDGKWKIIFFKKYMETWYFLCTRTDATNRTPRKNTAKGDWHPRLTF